MKITISALAFFCLCSFSLFAQSPYSIKGAVVDTSMNKKLEKATITILNAKDSTLYKFTRVKQDGSFSINNIIKGKFILLVTYPQYADYVTPFGLDSAIQTRDFKQINMISKASILAAVIIKGPAGITIKGDTTEFGRGTFVVQPNSKVEDLLKQLPGIEIDQDGKITAQGERVNKVLLDGEEFFGDDPTLVTRNIRGDMVEKFQLYDKKSDQATFTGVDDGVKTKTINVVLREDKKNGFFGKVDGGGAANNLYQSQGMFNVFQRKMKFSAYGNIGTTGRSGLSFDDATRFGTGGGSNAIMMEGGGMMISIGSSDELEGFGGTYRGNGLPFTRTSGSVYTNKWNKDKESINLSYKIGDMSNETGSTSISQISQPTDVILNNRSNSSKSYIFRQKLDFAYDYKPSLSTSLKITADATLKNTESNTTSASSNMFSNNTLQNDNSDISSGDGDQKTFNSGILWTKMFKKKVGRTTSVNVKYTYIEGAETDLRNSTSNLYVTNKSQHFDQLTNQDSRTSGLSTIMTWNEPLSKALSLSLNYTFNLSNSSNSKEVFDKSAIGQYDSLNTEYSNDFDYKQLTNNSRIAFVYRKNKNTFNFGTTISNVNYDQFDNDTDMRYKRNFTNWIPQATYTYSPIPQKRLTVSYSGSTVQPSINQLQPVKNNADALRIIIGNPDLKPYYRNGLTFGYSSSKPQGFQSFSVTGTYSISTGTMSSKSSIDTDGRSIVQTINLDEMPSNFSIRTSYSKRLTKPTLSLSLSASFNGGTSFNLYNNELNTSKNYGYSGSIGVTKSVVKKYTFQVYITPNYSKSTQTLRNLTGNPLTINTSSYFTLYLPGKTEISSNITYRITAKSETALGPIRNSAVWGSTISKKFLKTETLKLSLECKDILNQNTNQSVSANSQSTSLAIKRYFLGSLSWDFSRMGVTKTQKQ